MVVFPLKPGDDDNIVGEPIGELLAGPILIPDWE